MITFNLLWKNGANRVLRYAATGAILFNIAYLAIFYLVARVTGSFDELRRLWPWGVAIGILFGIQCGLYGYARTVLSDRKTGFGRTLALSGGGSLGSMVACCAHLLVLFLPLLGISFIAGLLGRLQVTLLYLSLFINAFAISTQLLIMKRHGIFPFHSWFARINMEHLKTIRLSIIALSIPVLLLSYTTISETFETDAALRDTPVESVAPTVSRWSELSDSANMVSVSVLPMLDDYEQRIGFRIAFETHSVALTFDPKQVAELTIDQNFSMQASQWDGPPPGGHHISGTLWFPGRQDAPEQLALVLKGIAGKDREFQWN